MRSQGFFCWPTLIMQQRAGSVKLFQFGAVVNTSDVVKTQTWLSFYSCYRWAVSCYMFVMSNAVTVCCFQQVVKGQEQKDLLASFCSFGLLNIEFCSVLKYGSAKFSSRWDPSEQSTEMWWDCRGPLCLSLHSPLCFSWIDPCHNR